MNAQIRQFIARLNLLESTLKNLKTDNARIRELRKSAYILRELLKTEQIHDPYGKQSVIVRFSTQ